MQLRRAVDNHVLAGLESVEYLALAVERLRADLHRLEGSLAARDLPQAERDLREGTWQGWDPRRWRGFELSDATTFAGDLEWDSLTVMDFVAEVEDSFDIVITMNMQAEIENVGQLVDAVLKLTN